jgi:glutathione S-transferase
VVGLALAACEKSVQIVYERVQRPQDKRHEPWMARVTVQLLGAYAALEAELARSPLAADRASISDAGICTAVAWRFTREMTGDAVPAGDFPLIGAYSATAEALPEFLAAQYGSSTYVDAH